MIKAGMNEFVDVVTSFGPSKITKTGKIKNQSKYHPSQDFYKKIRERLVEFNADDCSWGDVVDVLGEVDTRKVPHYKKIISGYGTWFKRKKTTSLPCYKGEFSHNDLAIRVNPEIAVEANGVSYLIKLFFRKDDLDSGAAKVYLALMECSLREKYGDEFIFAVMDVQRGRMFTNKIDVAKYEPYLRGEMDFITSVIGKGNA